MQSSALVRDNDPGSVSVSGGGSCSLKTTDIAGGIVSLARGPLDRHPRRASAPFLVPFWLESLRRVRSEDLRAIFHAMVARKAEAPRSGRNKAREQVRIRVHSIEILVYPDIYPDIMSG